LIDMARLNFYPGPRVMRNDIQECALPATPGAGFRPPPRRALARDRQRCFPASGRTR
jgi:hypothetical protein